MHLAAQREHVTMLAQDREDVTRVAELGSDSNIIIRAHLRSNDEIRV
jgi:hypothetical protein